jgi:hypothetical protein
MREGIQREKMAIARNMLSKGYQANAVLDLTGLSKEKLEKLSQASI